MTVLLLLAAQAVTGTVQYEDRDYTPLGFTGGITPRTVRFADVQILQWGTNSVLQSGSTDAAGNFSIGPIPPGTTVFARIIAAHAGDQINAQVLNNFSQNATYAVASGPLDTSLSTAFGTILITIAGGAAPAFNIFDCAVKSFLYQASVDADLPAAPPLLPALRIFWEANGATGTFFSRTLDALFLLGTSADPDEYDDDIILHEIGHWVAFHFSKDDTLGGEHSVTDQLDPRTAWSEGWAHYWSATVRRSMPAEYGSPQRLVDNLGGGAASEFNIETPSFALVAVGATNELAVAAVLWDITDTGVEAPFDLISGNEVEVWQAVNNRIPARSTITLEDFREGLALEAPGLMSAVTGSESTDGIMKARGILYYPDSSESNDTSGAAAVLPLGTAGLLQRTFFATGDADWYQVALIPGVLIAETRNLGDGADTLLELFAPDGVTLLASNDNRAPGDRSSLIQFAIAAGATYFLRVTNVSLVVENGHYDIRAQVVLNVPPVITSVTASATSGVAPLRVTLDASASDFENAYLEYQWDFTGAGRFDWGSFRGPRITTTYAKPGAYTATLRVVDGAAATDSWSVLINVLPAASPSILFSQDSPGGAAPVAVQFTPSVFGIVPATYSWDLDGDGIPDHVSVTGAPVAFLFREAGTFVPRLTVTDVDGRAFQVPGATVTVTAASPPSVSLTVSNGNIPFASTLTPTAPGSVSIDYDLDGTGRTELVDTLLLPLAVEIQRAGIFTVRARGTDASGVSAWGTATLTATAIGTRGWMVGPRSGDALGGSSVTLTAEAIPNGTSKSVQFQYRVDTPPGPWVDIGGPIVSGGTLFSTRWDVTGLAPATVVDLRILVDGTISSGDLSNVVLANAASPTWGESGDTLDAVLDPQRTKVLRNGAGVWVLTPVGGPSTLGLSAAARPPGNGSALGRFPIGGTWRLSGPGPFVRPPRIRLPAPFDDPALEVHAYDETARVWIRAGISSIAHADAWVEADAIIPGLYALFAEPPMDVGTNRFCSARADGNPGGWIVVLALGILLCGRRR